VRAVVLEHAWEPFLSFRDENYYLSSKEKPFIQKEREREMREKERERKRERKRKRPLRRVLSV
jgi:hypothetical protein